MKNLSDCRSIGVIDIGSNSIRLVAYDLTASPPKRFFNEKVICRLGKNIDVKGRLHPKGKKRAKLALKGFLILTEVMKLDHIHAIATSAMREATDGAEFAALLTKKHGLEIEIIDGAREAQLSALGVHSALDDVNGLVADLGGGSLELANISDGIVSDALSLPLGVLRLPDDHSKAKEMIRDKLAGSIKAYKDCSRLYAVGGSWRVIAHAHQVDTACSLRDTHGYRLPADELKGFCTRISDMSSKQIVKAYDTEKKRAGLLPAAAAVLETLIETFQPPEVIFSNAGLRDGLIYELSA
jgi:exopolyphosphatase/guanosine-5'-triphosphate,3'-diphosphate pyrophosphatase